MLSGSVGATPGGLRAFDLTGKIALVTGATRGLGRAIASGLAHAGAEVVVAGRREHAVDATVEELTAAGANASGVLLDVTDHDGIDRTLREVVETTGRLDILVNNAGVIERFPAEQYPLESWHRVMDTNLTSAFVLCQAAGRIMLDQGDGKIVNVASVLAYSGGRNVVAYAVSKGGLVQLTRALAAEWAGCGVNVNAIAAGYFRTDLTESLRNNENRERSLLARIPAGRWGEPVELAGTVVFLCSAAASYVNGAVLEVDGGWTAA